MHLERYLARIGLDASLPPTIDSLYRLQRAHALSVPFENLDVQLGVPLDTDVRAAYDKIVERGRGGWCYEQNGLFGWALDALGFSVTRVAAAVMRHERGSVADANHLCLLVSMADERETIYLADVGFGGSLVEPLPLEEGSRRQPPYDVGLTRIDDGWRFVENDGGGEFSFDFVAKAGSEAELSARCRFLQTSPDSSFVRSLVAQRRFADSHLTLRGRVLTRVSDDAVKRCTLESADDLVTTLYENFGLDVPGAADLWPRVLARHAELFEAE